MNEQEQMQFFYEVFDASLPRLGPGDNLSTRKAFDELLAVKPAWREPSVLAGLRVLDLGCGNGTQTLQLAKHTGAKIVAVDNHQPFLEEMMRRAKLANVADQIVPILKDMGKLDYDAESYDLIWSEGALYSMGFRDGLSACHRLLVPGGLMAVTEMTWFKPDPPKECQESFDAAYPALTDVESNLSAMETAGLRVIQHFRLPDNSWTDAYYCPLEIRLQDMRANYADDSERVEMLESMQVEIEIFRKYSEYYGYVFYLMQKA